MGWVGEGGIPNTRNFREVEKGVFSRDSVYGVMGRTQALELGILNENPSSGVYCVP